MICPKCKSTIDDEDSFCPYCGATIAHDKEEVSYCTICGYRIKSSDSFCPNCGHKVDHKEERKTSDDLTLTEESSKEVHSDLEVYVGKNKYSYYNQAFNTIKNKSGGTWNWCAFLFGVYWFLYRKMYLPACIYLICHIATYTFVSIANNSYISILISLIYLAVHILFGVFANNIYYIKYQKDLEGAKTLTGDARSTYLYNHGSTNSAPVIVALIIIGIITSIIDYFYPTNVNFGAIFSLIFRGK